MSVIFLIWIFKAKYFCQDLGQLVNWQVHQILIRRQKVARKNFNCEETEKTASH